MLKGIWGDPVWSKVIATAIVAIAVAISSYFAGWWPTVTIVAVDAFEWAIAKTAVWNWLLVILSLCAAVVVIILGIAIWAVLFPTSSRASVPEVLSYTEEIIFGIRWRWAYDNGIYNLVAFCPTCDYQVHPRDVGAYAPIPRIEYRCDDCGAKLSTFEMPLEEVESRIRRHIQREIRKRLADSSKALEQ